MPVRQRAAIRCLLSFVTVALCSGAASADEPPRPNIVVVLADDLGWHDSTVYGATDVRTPHMQRLAADGLTFTHAFVASPSCAPSRAALLTGLMPARNGSEANHSFPRDDLKRLPAYLQELGYEVAAFGKVAHYNDNHRQGFDRHDKRYDVDFVAEYLSERDTSNPLCLFVGTHDPHVPWPENEGYDPAKLVLPPTHVDTPETRQFRAQYYTAITRADRLLGALYDLARDKLGQNTVVMFTSDHGAQWPLGKWNLYDAGTRVPLIVSWPGVTKAGGKSAAMVSWVDLLPTLVEVAGGRPPEGLDGRSFAAVLRGESETHRKEIFTTHSGDGKWNVYPMRSVRTREFKYIRNLHPEYRYTTHIDLAQNRDGVKYWRTWEAAAGSSEQAAGAVSRYRARPVEELYDVQSDPHELRNLAGDELHAERLDELRGRLDEWMKAQGDSRKVFNTPRLLSE